VLIQPAQEAPERGGRAVGIRPFGALPARHDLVAPFQDGVVLPAARNARSRIVDDDPTAAIRLEPAVLEADPAGGRVVRDGLALARAEKTRRVLHHQLCIREGLHVAVNGPLGVLDPQVLRQPGGLQAGVILVLGRLRLPEQAHADFDEADARVAVEACTERTDEVAVFLLIARVPILGNLFAVAGHLSRRVASENIIRHTYAAAARAVVGVQTHAVGLAEHPIGGQVVVEPGPVVFIGSRLESLPLDGDMAADDRVGLWTDVTVIVEEIDARWPHMGGVAQVRWACMRGCDRRTGARGQPWRFRHVGCGLQVEGAGLGRGGRRPNTVASAGEIPGEKDSQQAQRQGREPADFAHGSASEQTKKHNTYTLSTPNAQKRSVLVTGNADFALARSQGEGGDYRERSWIV